MTEVHRISSSPFKQEHDFLAVYDEGIFQVAGVCAVVLPCYSE